MIDSIETASTAIGERFRCAIDDPIIDGDYVVIRRGADCTVQVINVETGGRLKGSDKLAIKLYDITVKDQTYDVASSEAELKTTGQGHDTAKKTAGGAGIGALLGGIIGGGSGAAIGALAGGGGGLILSATGKKKLNVPAESRLVFRLAQPLPLD
jgi:hypothetical protein